MQQLFKLGENLARAQVPSVVVNMVRCGRMTALAKPDGGVRGIVSGDLETFGGSDDGPSSWDLR